MSSPQRNKSPAAPAPFTQLQDAGDGDGDDYSIGVVSPSLPMSPLKQSATKAPSTALAADLSDLSANESSEHDDIAGDSAGASTPNANVPAGSSDKLSLLTSSSAIPNATGAGVSTASVGTAGDAAGIAAAAASSRAAAKTAAASPSSKGKSKEVDEATVAAARERYSLYWRSAVVVVLLDFIITLIAFFSSAKWNFAELARTELEHWNRGVSFFDLAIICFVRTTILMFALPTVSYEGATRRWLTTLAYWVTFTSLVLVICKYVLWDWHAASATYTALLILALLFNLSELVLVVLVSPPAGREDWDPAAEEEREARSQRAAASAAAAAEAASIARGLHGAELEAHLQKEKARVEADEYNERQIAAQQRASREKQAMRMEELMHLLKPYFWPLGFIPRIVVVITWTALIASKTLSIIAPIFIGLAVDQVVDEDKMPWLYISLYCGFLFGSQALKQLQNAVYLQVKQEAFAQIAEFAFRHLHGLSLQWHLKKKMGNVLRSMDRGIASADTVVTYLFLYLLPCIVECFVVFIIFYLRFDEPALSIIVLVGVVLYLVVTLEMTIWRKKFRKATNKHDNEFHDRATDSLMNYEAVKYFGNEDHETARYIESVRKYQKYNVSTQVSLALLNTAQSFIIQGSLLLALFLTVWNVRQGSMSIGDFSSVNAYIMQLYTPLSFLGTIYDVVVQSFVDMQNLSELLAEHPDVNDAPDAAPLRLVNPSKGATIEFRDVCFTYPEQRSGSGLQKVSFTVAPGTTTAIVGTTGAGKSTIARLFFRFYDVTDGSILVDGQDIRSVNQASLRRAIGVVPQDTAMFNESVLHNIRYGKLDATMEEVEDACRKAQILDFILALPAQWETKVGERGLRLSGGEKQRVAIARALLKDPPVVLLDEATSALDTVKEQEIQGALLSLEKGRTTLVIAHRLSTVMHAEQIIVLEKGQIIERGRHAELIALGGKYAQLWSQQAAAAAEEEERLAAEAAAKAKAEAEAADEEALAAAEVEATAKAMSASAAKARARK